MTRKPQPPTVKPGGVKSDADWKGVRGNRYPWDAWFRVAAGRAVRLVPGRHYAGMLNSIQGMAYRNAKLRGLKVRVTLHDGYALLRVVGRAKK